MSVGRREVEVVAGGVVNFGVSMAERFESARNECGRLIGARMHANFDFVAVSASGTYGM